MQLTANCNRLVSRFYRVAVVSVMLSGTAWCPSLAQMSAPPAPGYPATPVAPKGAPNIVLIMTDDVGFAASSTFGGGVPTPTLDALAANGVRFNDFNTTALCSPTRAALLTGRNHHAVGFGQVPDLSVGREGYSSVIPKSAATIGQVLRASGYSTAWFGKNHNVPEWQNGPAGPFDQWARGLGFDYFYGFNAGWTDQFAPALIEDEKPIDPPKQRDYILDRDLADHAISWLRMQHIQGRGKPFFLYYAPGTAHAPLQAPKAWIDRFRGTFDAGWDVYRAETFARQKRMGIIPADATLTPLPPGIPPWDSLSADQKKVFTRYMEVYAAALGYCDSQIGRIVDSLRESGQLDNTIVLYIQGDNGASAEGGKNGSVGYGNALGADADLRYALEHLDEIGGPHTHGIGPAGWAVALDTPFSYYKLVASRLGGIRNGMVVSWPDRIKSHGVRNQFAHVTDIAPTLYALTGVTPPAEFNGVPQQPFNGVSLADVLDHPDVLSSHHVQYFEILGNAAIYEDGWMAATQMKPSQDPGSIAPATDAPWLLYDLNTDYSQSRDISAEHLDKLAHLRALFDTEARSNKVLPVVDNPLPLLVPEVRPVITAPGRYQFYPSDWRYNEGTFPSVMNRSWSVEADLTAPAGGGTGALVTQGSRFGGWGLLMLNGVPTFVYKNNLIDGTRVQAPTALTPGKHKIRVDFTLDGTGFGRGGGFTLSIDGKPVGTDKIGRTVAFKFSYEPAVIGRSGGPSLLDDYQPPFAYDGELSSVTVDLQPVVLPGGEGGAK